MAVAGLAVAAGAAGAGCAGPTGNVTVSAFPDGVPSPTGATANADLLAFQDGDGRWTQATGTGGVYHLQIDDERYGVAVGCHGTFGTGTSFYYQSVAEAAELAVNGCPPAIAAADRVTVNVSAQNAAELVDLWIGDSEDFLSSAGAGSVPLEVIKGTSDVYARTYDPEITGDLGVRVYRKPAFDVEMNQELSVDLMGAQPVDMLGLTVSDPANAGGFWGVFSSYLPAGSALSREVAASLGTPSPSWAALPAAARLPGDTARVLASETASAMPGAPLSSQAAFQEMATPASATLTTSGYLVVQPPTIDTNAVSQLSVTVPIEPSVLGHTISRASFTTQPSQVVLHEENMFVRPGWAQGQASVTLRVPDLRNLPDWSTDMELDSRTEVDWLILVTDQDKPLDAPAGDRSGTLREVTGKVTRPGVARTATAPCRAERCGLPSASSLLSPFARRLP